MFRDIPLNARGRAVAAALVSAAEVAALVLLVGAGWCVAALLV